MDNDSDNEALVVDGDSPTLMGQNESMSEYQFTFLEWFHVKAL